MSQSDAHRQLVLAAERAIRLRHPDICVSTDLQDNPGDPVPPLIGGYRPDIVARSRTTCIQLIIAEAKTDGDIRNEHTLDQIRAFVDHLETMPHGAGAFLLAVNGHVADLARGVLRFTFRQRVSSRLHIGLFDGLDFWFLGPTGAPQWHLF